MLLGPGDKRKTKAVALERYNESPGGDEAQRYPLRFIHPEGRRSLEGTWADTGSLYAAATPASREGVWPEVVLVCVSAEKRKSPQ